MRWVFFLFISLILGVSQTDASQKSTIKEYDLRREIKKAEQFEKAEKFEKAKEVYERLEKSYALSSGQSKRIKSNSQKLQIAMFFSKAITPGSFAYTVKKGDRLFDIAQKFNTTMDLIRKSNRLKEDAIRIGSKIKIVRGVFEIKVDKSLNKMTLFFDQKLVKEYSVTTGSNNKTPVGKYKIINKVENPDWYFGAKVIPSGSKKNMLGTRWMGFDIASYGIHGTTEPESIGKQASLGCVRMLNRDIEELYTLVPQGISVTITD